MPSSVTSPSSLSELPLVRIGDIEEANPHRATRFLEEIAAVSDREEDSINPTSATEDHQGGMQPNDNTDAQSRLLSVLEEARLSPFIPYSPSTPSSPASIPPTPGVRPPTFNNYLPTPDATPQNPPSNTPTPWAPPPPQIKPSNAATTAMSTWGKLPAGTPPWVQPPTDTPPWAKPPLNTPPSWSNSTPPSRMNLYGNYRITPATNPLGSLPPTWDYNPPYYTPVGADMNRVLELMVQDSVLWPHLLKLAVIDSGLDSAARFPPPRCHDATRRELRGRIISWITEGGRSSNLLWLRGSIGIGKSAIAQTIAEYCKNSSWLGAAFFFSQSGNCNDPNRVIPSLVYQLLVTYPTYKEYASRIIIANPAILQQSIPIQFQKLLTEPFLTMGIIPPRPSLIILDGLDECRDSTSQRELVGLVAKFSATARHQGLPFLWMITSRSEWQFTSPFSSDFWVEELQFDTPEAREDVSTLLNHGFAKIRGKYKNLLSLERPWPRRDQLSVIASSASGSLAFASAILQFVDNHEAAGPASRMETCLRFLMGGDPPEYGNPLEPLYALYQKIVWTIHPADQITTLKILLVLSLTDQDIPAQILANVLFLDQPTFYRCLLALGSALNVPQPMDAGTLPIKFHHTSFKGFLRQTIAAGSPNITVTDAYAQIQACCLQWIDVWVNSDKISARAGLSSKMSWPGEFTLNDVVWVVAAQTWKVWSGATDRVMPRLYESLCTFNFAKHHNTGFFSQNIYPNLRQSAPDITRFLCKLSAWQAKEVYNNGSSILRSRPNCSTDQHLVEEYAYLVNYSGIQEVNFQRLEAEPSAWSFACMSLKARPTGLHAFPAVREVLLNPNPMYFFLGYETNSCLVVAYQPILEIRSFFSGAFEQMRIMYPGVNTAGNQIWPVAEDVGEIISASGTSQLWHHVPSLPRTVVAFVGHPEYADPVTRLKQVTAIISDNRDQTTILELLRKQSISDIPETARPLVDLVLAFLVCHAKRTCNHGIPTDQMTSFLGLDKAILEQVLRLANLILSSSPLPFPMGGVTDFDPSDLFEYCLGDSAYINESFNDTSLPDDNRPRISPRTWSELSVHYIRWCNLLGDTPEDDDSEKSDTEHVAREKESEALFKQDVMAGGYWIAFGQVTRETATETVAVLKESCFFRMAALCSAFHLDSHDDMAANFGSFINKLYTFQASGLDLEHIVRVDRSSDRDDELLARWTTPKTMCRKANFPIDTSVATCYFTTSQANWSSESIEAGDHWSYFWMGHGLDTCLVTFQLEDDD